MVEDWIGGEMEGLSKQVGRALRARPAQETVKGARVFAVRGHSSFVVVLDCPFI